LRKFAEEEETMVRLVEEGLHEWMGDD